MSLTRDLTSAERLDWAERYAQPPDDRQARSASALVFRLGAEWLGLPGSCLVTASEPTVAHRIPHRRSPLLRGIVPVRGQLHPCIALDLLLAVAPAGQTGGFPRLLLLRVGRRDWAVQVDEVLGLQRYAPSDVQLPPATLGGELLSYLGGVYREGPHQVGLIDLARLERALEEALR
ncbi:chemotaxis protein CheW [Pseudomonas sp. JBR1]|uniref:chemotaxis protein CheW n=1 Tax=Pseudomonas sp. JBR1 TaxID=3020907 RepID=UPI00230643B8|nr:chemotaxis protein CheW [Pseudomonas sp. JBR1]WCE10023.1 chemotaxis protein CheW [Pseudomonas sp. JBR1]